MFMETLLPISLGIIFVAVHLPTKRQCKKGSMCTAESSRKSSIFWPSASTQVISELYSLILVWKQNLLYRTALDLPFQTQCWTQRQTLLSIWHAGFEQTEHFRQDFKSRCNMRLEFQIGRNSSGWINPMCTGWLLIPSLYLANLSDIIKTLFLSQEFFPLLPLDFSMVTPSAPLWILGHVWHPSVFNAISDHRIKTHSDYADRGESSSLLFPMSLKKPTWELDFTL